MIQYVPPSNKEVMSLVLQKHNLLQLNRGCEVGVRHGEFTEYLLINNPKLSMVCVDSYQPYVDVHETYDEEHQERIKKGMTARLKPFNKRVHFLFKPSLEAVKNVPEGYCDFVFIDASHDYEDVKQDCDAWITRVRSGGIISGHDYSMQAVRKAVTEIITGKYGKTINHSPIESDCWFAQI